MKEFWETTYSQNEYVYGKDPNLFFKEYLNGIKPGKLFLPGDGEGRNTVYAAQKGWDVEAMDLTDSGRIKAEKLAAENGVTINFNTGNLIDYTLVPDSYDLIALIFVHFPHELRSEIHTKLTSSLKKGGHLIVEAFSKKQFGQITGGPRNYDLLYDREILMRDFHSLEINDIYETEQFLKEGNYHNGKSCQIRMIARKS